MALLHVQLVTPEKTVLETEAASVTLPAVTGQITLLPGHTLLVTELAPGELIVRPSAGQPRVLSVVGGFAHVAPGNRVVVLVDTALHTHELDERGIAEAVARARLRLGEEALSAEEYAVVTASMERNLSHLRVARKHAHRHRAGVTGEGVLEDT